MTQFRRFYTVGGTVNGATSLYVNREADTYLYDCCRNGLYSFILSSRQIGKSSLVAATSTKLEMEQIRPVTISLEYFDTDPDAWFLSFFYEVCFQLGLKDEPADFWDSLAKHSVSERLLRFFQEIVLPQIEGPIVIFVDEIDSLLKVTFRDIFFSTIRVMHNRRTHEPAFERLTFVLIGVATPSELISATERTPFNIGVRVELSDFTAEESSKLAEGLKLPIQNARDTMNRVLYWTDGHPYLTQRVCYEIARKNLAKCSKQVVDQIVRELFFADTTDHDDHLDFVQTMMLKRSPDREEIIKLYRDVRLDLLPVKHDAQSQAQTHLKLSGIVKVENGYLKVRNRIYSSSFDRKWINKHSKLRWYVELPTLVKALILVLVATVMGLIILSFISFRARAEAVQQAELAEAAAAGLRVSVAENVMLQTDIMVTPPDLPMLLAQGSYGIVDNAATRTGLLNNANKFPALEVMLRGHTAQIETAALHPTQPVLATSGFDGQIRLWDTKTWAELSTSPISATTGTVLSVAFSPDGTQLATVGDDGKLALWDTASWQLVAEPWVGHGRWAFDIVFEPDGQTLVSGSAGGDLMFWDIEASGMITRSVPAHADEINTIALSSDGKTAASAGRDHGIILWDRLQEIPNSPPLMGHDDWVTDLSFNYDGSLLASSSLDKSIIIWDVTTQRQIRKIENAGGEGNVIAVAFIYPKNVLATAGSSGNIRFYDILTGEESLPPLIGHTQEVRSLTYDAANNRLISNGNDLAVMVWDLNRGQGNGHVGIGHQGKINAIVSTPDEKLIISAGEDKTIRFWHAQSLEEAQEAWNMDGIVETVTISPDGTQLAAGIRESGVIIFDSTTGAEIAFLKDIFDGFVESIAYSPNGGLLSVADTSGQIRVWKTGSWELQPFEFINHVDGVESLAFSPNGQYMAAASYDGTTSIWKVESGDLHTALVDQAANWVHKVLFIDDETVATAHANHNINIWRFNQPNPLSQTLQGHTHEVNALALNGDQSKLVSVGRDQKIIIWDLDQGKPLIGPFQGHEGWIWDVRYAVDGQTIYTAGDDGLVIRWDLSLDKAQGLICQKVNRPITIDEWDFYFGSFIPYDPLCTKS